MLLLPRYSGAAQRKMKKSCRGIYRISKTVLLWQLFSFTHDIVLWGKESLFRVKIYMIDLVAIVDIDVVQVKFVLENVHVSLIE